MIGGAMARVLEEGVLCAVAAPTPRGPHCTPTVFVWAGGRLWITTARSSAKARAWRREATAAGMVRLGDVSVSFSGRARRHDALDPETWAGSLLSAPLAATAAARFTMKNARFFAGYAVDARSVPLAWTPPGRVFVSVEPERAALVDHRGVLETVGRWGYGVGSQESFRAARGDADPLGGLPADVAKAVGRAGRGALAVEAGSGPVVLDAGWVAEEGVLYAGMPEDAWALAVAGAEARVALVADRASVWRARDMVGVMVQGDASAFAARRLARGARSALAKASSAGVDGDDVVLLRLAPRRVVWWRGWRSGTVVPG